MKYPIRKEKHFLNKILFLRRNIKGILNNQKRNPKKTRGEAEKNNIYNLIITIVISTLVAIAANLLLRIGELNIHSILQTKEKENLYTNLVQISQKKM